MDPEREGGFLDGIIKGRGSHAILAFGILAVAIALAAALGFEAYLEGEQVWQNLFDAASPRMSLDVLESVQAVPALKLFLVVALTQWGALSAAILGALAVLIRGRLFPIHLVVIGMVSVTLFVRECFNVQARMVAEADWAPVLPLWSVPVGGSALLVAALFAGGWIFRRLVGRMSPGAA